MKTLFYTAMFVIGFIGVSLWSFWLITKPARIVSTVLPSQLGLPAEDIVLVTDDDVKISGWLISKDTEEKRQIIIILHGYPADKGDMLFLAQELYEEFDVLLIDFRYFGQSEGSYTTLGAKEQLDLKAATDFLGREGYSKIGILGFSLGGAVGIMNAAQDERIRAVVSYAGFADLKILGHEAYQNLFILKKPLVSLIILWARLFYDVDMLKVAPMDVASKLKIPVFIIHTKPDEQISINHAYLLKEALKGNSEARFYFPERGLHGHLPPDFEERVIKFFIEALK